jgi:peptidoglycan/LPS O-acetylase OafA/YrhL
MMCHLVGTVMMMTPLMEYSPIYLIVGAGHEAVIFFFILSGFVLSLPFYSGKKTSYITYLIRRVFRIYLPFAVAMLGALLLCHLFFQGGVQNFGDWLSNKWTKDVTLSTTWQQLNLLSNHETTTYNPIVWSLITEMRISIIFPLLMLFINRFHWLASIAMGLGCSIVGGLNYTFHLENSIGLTTGYLDSVHFMAMFIIGALIAKHRQTLISKVSLFSRKNKILILVIAFFAYTYSRAIRIVPIPFLEVVVDWGISIGVAIIIIYSLSDLNFARFLERKTFSFLGKISYSLYLYHAVIIITTAHFLHDYTNAWVIAMVSIIPIFIISFVAWKWVEQPAIRVGKWIASVANKGNRGPVVENAKKVSF